MTRGSAFPIALIVFGAALMLGSLLDFYTTTPSTTNLVLGYLMMGFGVTSLSFGTIFGPGKNF